MGGGASVEEKQNSRLYREGYKSLQEGRYTYTKLYFEQAVEKHDGYAFWSSLDPLVELEAKAGKHKGKRDGDRADAKQAQKKPEGFVDDPSALPEADGALEGENGDEVGRHLIEFPLDSRAMDVLDYLQLRGNIVNAYILADRMEEASVHAEYITSHTIVALKYFRIARDECEAQNEGETDDNPLQRRNRQGAFMTGDTERETIFECFEQQLRVHWISSIANSAYAAFKRGMGTQGEKKRKKDLDAAVHKCLLGEEAIINIAKMRANAAVNEVLLKHLESALDDLDAASSSGSGDDADKENPLAADNSKQKENPALINFPDADNGENGEDLVYHVVLQRVDRRALCRAIPTPSMEAALRYVVWVEDGIQRLIPGRNAFIHPQTGGMLEKEKKKYIKQQNAMRYIGDKRPEYGDIANVMGSFDEENALLLFPLLLIQADIQLELGAATKGIQTIDSVERITKLMYDPESPEHACLLHHVAESRKRGGALFMMFEDQQLVM